MLIRRNECDTKELRNAFCNLERAIKKINELGFVLCCGKGRDEVYIHTKDDWKEGDITYENAVASLDNVLAEGKDY